MFRFSFVTFDSWRWYQAVTTVRVVSGVVDVEAIENKTKQNKTKKQERDVFHGKTNSGWEIN